MARSRYSLLALIMILAMSREAQSQNSVTQPSEISKIHALGELSNDPNLCKWIAETIPEVVQPGSWNKAGGRGVISYYGPAKVLVISQSQAVHTEIDEFLRNLKNSLATEKTSTKKQSTQDPAILQAQYKPSLDTGVSFSSPGADYLIPTPLQNPKHLFHMVFRLEGDFNFDTAKAEMLKKITGAQEDGKKESKDSLANSDTNINVPAMNKALCQFLVRYEGDGIIDENVVEFMKVYMKAMMEEKSEGDNPIKIATPPTPTGGVTMPPDDTKSKPAPLPPAPKQAPKERKQEDVEALGYNPINLLLQSLFANMNIPMQPTLPIVGSSISAKD